MRIFLLSFIFLLAFIPLTFGQNNYGILWQRPLGGTGIEGLQFTRKTNDNALLVIGSTYSANGNAASNHGIRDILIMKLTLDGSVIWQRCYGGPGIEYINDYYYDDTDGTTVIAAEGGGIGGDISTNRGGSDGWVFKIDNNGNIIWQRSYGGSSYDAFTKIQKSSNGDYLLEGSTSSNDGDVSGNHGGGDVWACKLNASGNLIWSKCYGGSLSDNISIIPYGRIIETADGNFLLTSVTQSADGDMTGNHGGYDIWLAKINNTDGSFLWSKLLGGTANEGFTDIKQASTGDIYIYGSASSPELPGFHNPPPGTTGGDLYLAKLNSAGQLIWQKCFGENNIDLAYQMEFSIDGSLVISSTIFGGGGDITGWHGGQDIWMAKIRPDATIEWQRALGGSYSEGIEAINQVTPFLARGSFSMLADGSVILSGVSNSYDGDVSGGHDNRGGPGYGVYFNGDIWVVKLGANGAVQWQRCLGGNTLDGAAGNIIPLDNGEYIAGGLVGSNDGNVNGGHGISFTLPDMWVCRVGPASTIKGNVYVDYNANQIHDAGEPFFGNAIVQSAKPGYSKSSISTQGAFQNDVDTGQYITTCIPFKNYYTITPISKASNFPVYGLVDSFDFALVPVPGKRDLVINIVPLSGARPGGYSGYNINYRNWGTEVISSGEISFVMDSRTNFVSCFPAYNSISGDTLRWIFSNLKPLDTGSIRVVLHMASPPVLNLNDTLHYHAVINPVAGDEFPADNDSYLHQIVSNAYDPNDKTEKNAGVISTQQVARGEYLEYLVRFQNTGTDTAFNVYLADTLDNRLDWSTLEVISASHPFMMNVKGGRFCKWMFNNIKLPDMGHNEPASHGYISYRIRPKKDLKAGDSIRNKAAIYFDYNLPVITNTQLTVIKNITVVSQTGNDELYVVDVFPQPARSLINIAFRRNLSGNLLISILDEQGRLVQQNDKGFVNTNGLSVPVDVSQLPKGIYFLMVKLNQRLVQTKIIIQ